MQPKPKIYLLSPTPRDGTISLPMIRFDTVASTLELDGIDTLMFTSKQAVVTANEIDTHWKTIPSIAIGSATKKQIELLGGRVLATPQSYYGKELSREILEHFRDKNILYLRPDEISFDSKSFLQSQGVSIREQIIYHTSCISYEIAKAPNANSTIIFTSPSTIKCFLQNFPWLPSYTAIVIGKSTLEHLPPNTNYLISDKPTIDACVEKANQHINN